MPRTRRYQPIPDNVCEDRVIDLQPESAQVLYFRLLAKCDDLGRYYADPHMVKAHLFPYADHVTVSDVETRLRSLHDAGIIVVYLDSTQDLCLQLVNYLVSSKNLHPKFEAPPREVLNGAERKRKELNGTNGTFWDKRESFVPLTPLTVTVTETVTHNHNTQPKPEPEPEPEHPGGQPARRVSAGEPTDSGSGSVAESVCCGGGEISGSESGNGNDYALPNALWQSCQASLRRKADGEAIEQFSRACVLILKPKGATDSDIADVRGLGRKLFRGDGAEEVIRRMFFYFNDAKATVEGHGGFGAWRTRAAKSEGDWKRKR